MLRMRAAAVAAAMVSGVVGCSSEGSPEEETTAAPTGAAQLRGMTLPAWNARDYDSPQAAAYLQDIAATGARWVVFTPTWYQDSLTDSSMHTTKETATDDSLRHIVQQAHNAGLKVMLKPHVDLAKGGDRAEIRPADPAAWFTSYERFITHYARLAADTGTEQLSVGTELAGTSHDSPHWSAVIAAVRSAYKGPLTYAANYDEYRNVPFWKDLDLIGVDAYFPLSGQPTADRARLREAWASIADQLAAFSAAQQRKVLFTEAGYVSQHGSTTAPYSWTVSTTEDTAEQAAAYEALLTALDGRPWWAGVCWWMWDDWPDTGETPRNLAYTPHGKPAEDVLKQRWGGATR